MLTTSAAVAEKNFFKIMTRKLANCLMRNSFGSLNGVANDGIVILRSFNSICRRINNGGTTFIIGEGWPSIIRAKTLDAPNFFPYSDRGGCCIRRVLLKNFTRQYHFWCRENTIVSSSLTNRFENFHHPFFSSSSFNKFLVRFYRKKSNSFNSSTSLNINHQPSNTTTMEQLDFLQSKRPNSSMSITSSSLSSSNKENDERSKIFYDTKIDSLFNFDKVNTSSVEQDNINIAAKNSNGKPLRIIVEGNIGSGKTTFLQIFSKRCCSLEQKPLIIAEPIDLWRNVGGTNIFQLLADDPKRWSFTFQSYVQLTMVKIHELMPEHSKVKVMERSLYSARYCFVENLIRKNLLESCEYHVLDKWFKSCVSSAPVDLIIYLRTDPDIVFERIKRRGRPEESRLTLDYLRSLHELHENWLIDEKFPLPAPVVIFDANIPLEKIMPIYEEKTGNILLEHMSVS